MGPKFRYFGSELLKTLEDGLIYSFQYFLGVRKHHVFGNKLLGTLGDALTGRELTLGYLRSYRLSAEMSESFFKKYSHLYP